ncbi:MAG: hypothetical protein KF784_06345 [Fimbriimonadaceae bacterium]|nr:hypothetical protein [Fimbriimonadaceae bacterium]
MTELKKKLVPFEKRVRIVRAWKGLAIGACAGAGLSLVWAILDFFRVWYTEWLWLGIVAGVCAIVGAVVGLLMKVPAEGLADSIDRRAELRERLSTALEDDKGTFHDAQESDAMQRVSGLKPTQVYPIRVGRQHGLFLAIAAVASTIFLLGNTPLFLSDKDKAAMKELKEASAAVERVMKPILDDKEKGETPEKDLARKIQQFAREMERARMNKEEALERANELAKEAEKLIKERAEGMEKNILNAESAWQKFEQEKLKEAGFENVNPEDLEKTDAQLDAEMMQLQQQISQMEQKLKDPSLSKAEREALEKQLNEAKNEMEGLKMSKKAKEFLKKLSEMKEFKELQEMLKKMKQAAGECKGGKCSLTKEQMEEMMKALEELADKLKGEKEMREFLEALKKAMEEGEGACEGEEMGMCLMGMLGLGNGPSGPGQDNWFRDTGQLPMSEEATTIEGKSNAIKASGLKREAEDPGMYIEVKGPAQLNGPSSVPLGQALPKYKKQAEKALDKQAIPKQYQGRVRDYFDSLSGGSTQKKTEPKKDK